MSAHRMPVDPDAGIPDLVRRLSDDSKRLLSDEVRLAKLELSESIDRSGAGAMWLAAAFGIGVIAAMMLTLFLATLIGRLAGGHMWVGAIVTAVLELGAALVLINRGRSVLRAPSYSLEQTRDSLKRRGAPSV